MFALRSRLDLGFLLDAVIGTILFVVGVGYVVVYAEIGPSVPWADSPSVAVSVIVVGLGTLPVIVRRRFPLTALLVGSAALLVARWLYVQEYQTTSIALFFLLIAAGSDGDARRRTPVRVAATVLLAIALGRGIWEERRFIDLGFYSERAWLLGVTIALAVNVVFIAGGWAIGELVRRQRERTAELERLNDELATQQQRLAERAVVDDRVRIAREIHDVVAHHVSVMGVQAGAARRVLANNPEGATAALTTIEDSSREAVRELQQLLTFLRGDRSADPDVPTGPPERGAGHDPLPGLDRLGELRAQVAAAGLAVRYREEGDARRLSPSLDLSAFRIVQEALTNVRKHGATEEADVTVRYGEDTLTLVIADRGAGSGAGTNDGAGSHDGGGNGLRGIRERVALHEGVVSAGPRPGGGFVVEAELPYERVAVAR
ncbi:MAG: sensor histidine kinase [Acidimicrobiales bacterium]